MKASPGDSTSFAEFLGEIAPRGRTMLLPALLKAQSLYGHIPIQTASEIGSALRVPLADITGVIEFYSMLYERTTAETMIRVCTSPTCASQGAQGLLEGLIQSLAIRPGQATADGKYYLECVECLGLCDQAPSALVDDAPIGHANPMPRPARPG